MDDLVTWLRAQLDEDERVASDAAGLGDSRRRWTREALSCVVDATDGGLIVYGEGRPTPEQADHIARWDPDRVLRKVEADRRILDAYESDDNDHLYGGCGDDCEWKALGWTVRLLALPYADRPGWRDDWRA